MDLCAVVARYLDVRPDRAARRKISRFSRSVGAEEFPKLGTTEVERQSAE